MRGIKPIRSLDYRSGSVRLYDFENQNQSLTDLNIPEVLLPVQLQILQY